MSTSFVASSAELKANPAMQRPHVVILGAGASVAAFPQGDKGGHRLPTMMNLVRMLGIDELLSRHRIKYNNKDFESIYSNLYKINKYSKILKEIEDIVYEYFSNLELPDHPTIYDHLVLSLRKKDAIFSFNWDPFLFDAWVRNRRFELPRIFFLHGNVRVACCPTHPDCWGTPWAHCDKCDSRLMPGKLLYPIQVKDYASDQFIATQWDSIRWFLGNAFTLTIFGYSAPHSDAEAKEIMKIAWKQAGEKIIERVEIIDIKDRNELYDNWKPFISYYHFDCRSSFYDSYITNYPRRSGEALYTATTEGRPAEFFPIPKEMDFPNLYSWLEPVVQHENEVIQ